jgi:hypothetical protein
VGDCIDPEDLPAREGERCASVSGVSLHANVAVPALDRRRLERLCRYVARPPVATQRLSLLEDGRLLYRLKHRWRDGTTHVIFEPQELVEKLAALVPPPRFHLVRYHGILGPCASERDRVIPGGPDPATQDRWPASPWPVAGSDGSPNADGGGSYDELKGRRPEAAAQESTRRISNLGPPNDASPSPDVPTTPRPQRLAWSELLRRVFAIDVLECPRCGGRMRLLAAIQPPEATQAILACLDLSTRAPPTAAALPDPENAGGRPVDFEASV